MATLNYTLGEEVEAVDGVGRWERGMTKKEGDGKLLVSFTGWSSRFDRWVGPDEVRSRRHFEFTAEDGRVPRRRNQKRTHSKLSNLEAGDYVTVKVDDRHLNAEVLTVDQFQGSVRCVVNGTATLIREESINPEETTEKEPVRILRKPKKTKKIRKAQINDTPQLGVQVAPDNLDQPEPAHTVLAHLNKEGIFIQGGEVYAFNPTTDLSVGVKTVTSDFNVVGKLIIGNEFRSDIEVCMPADLLTDKSIKLSRAAHGELADCSLLNNPAIIRNSSVHVRMGLRRALLGKHLRKEIKLGLKSKSFRRYFSLGTVCLEFDMEVLNMDRTHRVEYSHSKHNIGSMDSVLGTSWDVRKCMDQCTFVTKLVLRVKDLQLVGKVWCAICRDQLPADYRSFLSTYEVAPCDDATEDANDGGDFDW